MFQKLDEVEKRYEEVTRKISDPEIIAQQSQWQALMKEHAEIEPVVLKYKEYKKANQAIEDAKEMLKDPEMKELAEIEIEENKEKTNEVIKQLGVPGFIVELGLFNGIFKNFPEGETTLREVLPQQLTQTVNNVLVFIVLFILIMIVIAILKAILKKVAKIAGLNTINRLLGMAMGGIKITAIVVCVLAVLTIVGSFVGFIGNFVSNAVFTESAIGSSILKPIVEWVLTKISVG